MKNRFPNQTWFGAVLLGFMACGCRITVPEHGSLNPAIHARADTIVTTEQLRLRMRSLVDPLCGIIIASADQISNGTTNRPVQREALVWKIEAVPEMRKALFQPDPFTALADTWVFSYQMQAYFENGPGKEKLGTAHLLAAETCLRLEAEVAQLAAALTKSGDVTHARRFVQQWAAAHPIQNSIAARESTLSRATEQDIVSTFSAIEAVVNVTATVDDINRRVEVYSDQLFQQARWEAELFKLDLMNDLPLSQSLQLAERAVKSTEQAMGTVDRLAPAVERVLAVAEATPKIIAAEREATLNELHETIIAERKALVADFDQTSHKLVDHVFWRAIEFIAGVLIFLALGLVVVLIIVRRSRIKAQ